MMFVLCGIYGMYCSYGMCVMWGMSGTYTMVCMVIIFVWYVWYINFVWYVFVFILLYLGVCQKKWVIPLALYKKLFTIPSDFSFMYILYGIYRFADFVWFVLFLQLRYFTYSSVDFLIRGKYLAQEGWEWGVEALQWGTTVYSLHRSPNIVKVIKSRRLRWAGHVARIDEGRIFSKY